MVARFSGRDPEELARTTEEEATIVFVDLVDFTPRAGTLPPAEVMSTVRGFFELAVPLLVEEKIRPLSCLGDGLLAISEGSEHAARGLAFARRLVARAGRASIARTALGERWGLAVRAGVASGPVVKGVLGNLLKLEYAAIGLTTNLAARLQSKANPGEVLCSARTAAAADIEAREEMLELKGFATPIGAVRLEVDPLELSAAASGGASALRSRTT
jgi:adenylate cyclase